MARKTTEAAATTKSPAKKRTVTRRVKKTEADVLSVEHIATRAYYISLETGNDPVENWLQAEREFATA